MAQTVVCFGDSITCGQISANYVDMLEERMYRDNFVFINEGVNNDLTYNLLRRIDDVILVQPDFITILIGTNDVISSVRWTGALYNILRKRLPRWPLLEWSYANLLEIIGRLKKETDATLAVCSIPVLGEDLTSRPNRRVMEYNESLKAIAAREGVAYLPVNERQRQYLIANGLDHGRPYRGSIHLTLDYLVRYLLVHESFETFSRREGFNLLTDGVHLNRRGARFIADLVEEFLRNC